MTGEKTAKKDRDPIFTICAVIFVIAAIIAVGCWINNEYFESSDATASDGDKVTVDYTGTYYDYLGEKNAVVFDTSYSDVGDDDSIAKSNDYTAKTSYSSLSYTIGGTTVLEKFGNAVIGLKVGEKTKVYLSETEGYIGPSTDKTLNTTNNTMDASFSMPYAEFHEAYEDVTLVNDQMVKFETKYTWDGYAVLSDNGKVVNITYIPEVKSYEVYKSGDTTVDFVVKSVEDNTITYDIEIKNPVKVNSSEIQMIKLDLGTDVIYITDINGDEITYKTGSERLNQPLYFEIELVSID